MDVYNYTVSFDPAATPPITLTPLESAPTFPVTVTKSITLFTFSLSAPTSPGAAFLTYPMQWFTGPVSSLEPDNPPPDFQVHSYNPTYFAVWDFNSTPAPTPHTFYIIVFYENELYWGDPTIINEPPDS